MNRTRTILYALLFLVTLGGALAAWRWWPRPGAARVTFLNTRPGVNYVGDRVCAKCHNEETETYRHHPMSRTLTPAAEAVPLERTDAAARNPFEQSGFRFTVEKGPDGWVHAQHLLDAQGQPVAHRSAAIRHAIGSGAHGRTYLVETEGRLFQSPISWFTQEGRWDLTPGFDPREGFDRPADATCLFCHSNHVEPVPGTVNAYRDPVHPGHAIGCERCHGPGELHARARGAAEAVGAIDTTIVNPKHLEPALRDAVCQQCHLLGETRVTRRGRSPYDYRPGLPLGDFVTAFLRAPEFSDTPAGNLVQLESSRCFQASAGRMGCTSCHDPHAVPTPGERVGYFRNRCLSCHADKGCALPPAERQAQQPDDSCAACHMPRASRRIVHTAFTDHRIRRRPAPAAEPGPAKRIPPGTIPLVPYPRDRGGPNGNATGRDLGLALVKMGRDHPPLGRLGSSLALPILEKAAAADPGDLPALEDYGFALWLQGRKDEARAAFDRVLAQAPRREMTLTYAAALAADQERLTDAAQLWERAVEVNPWTSTYHARLAKARAGLGRWAEALAAAETSLRLNPAPEDVRTLLVQSAARAGQAERARAELETLIRFKPAEADVLRRWLAEQMR